MDKKEGRKAFVKAKSKDFIKDEPAKNSQESARRQGSVI